MSLELTFPRVRIAYWGEGVGCEWRLELMIYFWLHFACFSVPLCPLTCVLHPLQERRGTTRARRTGNAVALGSSPHSPLYAPFPLWPSGGKEAFLFGRGVIDLNFHTKRPCNFECHESLIYLVRSDFIFRTQL